MYFYKIKSSYSLVNEVIINTRTRPTVKYIGLGEPYHMHFNPALTINTDKIHDTKCFCSVLSPCMDNVSFLFFKFK